MNMPTVWQVLLWMGCFRIALKHIWGVLKSTPPSYSFLQKGGQKVAKIETYIKKEFHISFILNFL